MRLDSNVCGARDGLSQVLDAVEEMPVPVVRQEMLGQWRRGVHDDSVEYFPHHKLRLIRDRRQVDPLGHHSPHNGAGASWLW